MSHFGNILGNLGSLNQQNPPQCECHDCTQARYRTSFQYQLDQAMNPIRAVVSTEPIPSSSPTLIVPGEGEEK